MRDFMYISNYKHIYIAWCVYEYIIKLLLPTLCTDNLSHWISIVTVYLDEEIEFNRFLGLVLDL